MKNNQAKMAANLNEIRAGKELLKEMLAKIEAHHERMMARMNSQLEKMEACLGKTGDIDLEASPEEIMFEVEHEEVPKEAVAVETLGARKKQYGDRHSDVWRHRQLNKQTQGVSGSRKKLAAARRG
jgi:hypothetical protein